MLCRLVDPEDVKRCIAEKAVSEGFKSNLCDAYGHYVAVHKLTWIRPRYQRQKGLPRVPSTENVERIIARCSWQYATIFCILRDCGAMPEELHRVKRPDINLDAGTVNLPGCKYHKPRVGKLKTATVDLLCRYLLTHLGDFPFPNYDKQYEAWRRARNDVAEKFGDPSIKGIRLYDLRHYFGTHHFRKIKNILATKEAMGHTRIETTLVYTKLVTSDVGEFTCAVAKTVDEAKALVEDGFEFVCEIEGVKLFRRPR
jgi:integrase